jgi:hypothetical protein
MPGPVALTVYLDANCTQLANITGLNNVALAGSIIHIDSDGLLPEFLGPADGTSTLYVKSPGAAGGYAVYAEAAQRLDVLEGAVGRPGYFVFAQNTDAATWTIIHNLGFMPGGVTVLDTAGTQVFAPTIDYVDDNTLTLQFGLAFSGKAYLS